MKRNNAWLAQLGILFFTFAIGFGMGFSIRHAMKPVESPTIATASDIPVARSAEKPGPNEEAVPKPAETASPPVESPPAPVPAPVSSPAPESIWPARHLFIAVEGAWLSEESKALLREIRPGGVLLREGNLQSPNQTLALSREIKDTVGLGRQQFSALPLIAIEQEGGERNALALTDAPSGAQIGAAKDPAAAKRYGVSYGSGSADRGISVLFAPVLDVFDSAGALPGAESRSFGAEESLVTSLGLAMADGMMEAGVIPVVKTFPGFGPAVFGPDGRSLVLNIDNRRLAENMFPFSEAVAHKAPGVLIGHVAVPKFNTEDPQRPAALSRTLVHSLFRELWKYDGVLVADDVAFNPMTASRPAERAAVEALMAGCDAILFLDPDPARIRAVCQAIEAAAASGEIAKEQLGESKRRLDAWQSWLDRPRPLGESSPQLPLTFAKTPSPASSAPVEAPASLPPSSPIASAAEQTEPPVSSTSPDPVATSATDQDSPSLLPVSPISNATPGTDPSSRPASQVSAAPEATAEEPPSAPLDSAGATAPVGVTTLVSTDSPAPATSLSTDIASTPLPKESGAPATTAGPPQSAPANSPTPSATSAAGDTSFSIPPVESATPGAPVDSPPSVPQESVAPPVTLAESVAASVSAATKPSGTSPGSPRPEEPVPADSSAPAEVPASSPADSSTPDQPAPPVLADAATTSTETAQNDSSPSVIPNDAVPSGIPAPEPASHTLPVSEPSAPSASAENPPASTPPADRKEIAHTVQRQETLTAIAKLYGVEIQDLVAWNNLSNARIDAGQVLKVFPGGKADIAPKPAEPANNTYRVRRGDTLTKIATRHGISLKTLLEMNGLTDPNEIVIGQRLKVP